MSNDMDVSSFFVVVTLLVIFKVKKELKRPEEDV